MLEGQSYRQLMESCASFNVHLKNERKTRLPFIDTHTGVAQNDCYLWHNKQFRLQGVSPYQIYSYPARRWKKKKRAYLEYQSRKSGELDSDMHQINTVENPALKDDQGGEYDQMVKESGWYEDLDGFSDPPDAGEMEDRLSDYSDYEETYKKRRKKGTRGGGRGRKKNLEKEAFPEEKEKPFGCDMCGARYKTRPGLTYHLTHFHSGMVDAHDESSAPSPKIPSTIPATSPVVDEGKPVTTKDPSKLNASQYCDFCLGDSAENKKTNQPEELVSCSDCGRSGHPSCLQFTANMILSVKKYPWQCIECKSCGLCGTSDNDDQLLFCDDCDRGYHMYCLDPPLSEPPEGSWSCHLCIEEFHGGKKPLAKP
ncbi:zinc finger protein ubi-d4-like [Tubulanus polymorphus]|uniref:zinc finger protein ubi-d4-like n=1 Tax=Tubulanus polymorphus TaxID=672921 RepID=UPI003DA33A70